jgi:curli biogenesis system outer membrane secretion channel CsgG
MKRGFPLTPHFLYIKIKVSLRKGRELLETNKELAGMKRVFLILSVGCLISVLVGCAVLRPKVQVEPTAGVQALPPYSGLKARIAIADFEVKAAKATDEIGSGLREMLITASTNSNRFNVVERQVLEAVMKEQELSASGATDQATQIERSKIKTPDLIITATVTEFEPEASGGRAGVGGGGGVGSGALGAMLGGASNKAHLALEVRVTDTSTSEVLAATPVEGQASDISGAIMAGFLGAWDLGSGLSAYANTPMEKAIRICIIEAVKYIAQATPADYYKY